MRNALFRAVLGFAVFTGSQVAAADPDWLAIMSETVWDWHPGDLIFRNGLNDVDDLIRDAEGGQWASVGIMRSSSGSPRVVYVDQEQGVTEVMIDEFTKGLSEREYAVYRIGSLDPNNPGEQMEQGPIALLVAYGAGYDRQMILGNDRYYNAELPYMAAMSFGVVPGVPVPLEKLGAQSGALRDALLVNWEEHPFCVVAASREECWNEIGGISVITPGQLIASDRLTRVFPD